MSLNSGIPLKKLYFRFRPELLNAMKFSIGFFLIFSASFLACHQEKKLTTPEAAIPSQLSPELISKLKEADSTASIDASKALLMYRSLAAEPGNGPAGFAIHSAMGFCYWSLKDFSKSKACLRKALKDTLHSDIKSLAKVNFLLGEIYNKETTHLDSAVYFRSATVALNKRVPNNDTAIVTSYMRLGKLYQILHQHELSDEQYEKARSLAEKVPTVSSQTLINIYLELAVGKMELRDNADALLFIQKGKKMIEEKSPLDYDKLGRTSSLMASISIKERQYQQAIEHFNTSIQLYKKGNVTRQLGRAYSNLSIVYQTIRDYPSALLSLNQSIRYNRQVLGEESVPLSNQYLIKGFVYQKMDRFDSASKLFHHSMKIRNELFGEKNINVYGVKVTLGSMFEQQGILDSALFYYQGSLISLVYSFNDQHWLMNPVPDPQEITTDLVDGLIAKARVLKRMARQDAVNTKLLEVAFDSYVLADSVLAEYRKYLSFEDMNLSLFDAEVIPYGEAIACAYLLYENKPEVQYLQGAYYMMERSRATLVQEGLSRAKAFNTAGMSPDFLQKENALVHERASLLQLYTDNRSDSLGGKLLKIDSRLHELRTNFGELNAAYSTIKYGNRPPEVVDLMKFLASRHAILLEYFWGREDLFVLKVSSTNSALIKIPLTQEWNESMDFVIRHVQQAPENISSPAEFRSFCAHAGRLYDVLIKHGLDGPNVQNRLIISPHGRLSLLPFEVLLTNMPDTSEVNYRLPYLISTHTISYSYSSGQLLENPNRRMGRRLLALGFSGDLQTAQDDKRSDWNGLPGTELEIESIRKVMDDRKNEYYLAGDASESTFKRNAPKFNILHLAVHGESDTLNGVKSRLIFRSEKDSVEDGNLYAYELYDMNLDNVELVVLSACESGLGKQQKGEGLLSIARGFAYAGCPSQVISLWKISDRVTSGIMAGFYSHLSVDDPVDVSLQKAKLEYLNEAGEFKSHPNYWAAFLPVGDVGDSNVSSPYKWILYLTIPLLIFFIFKRMYLRSKSSTAVS